MVYIFIFICWRDFAAAVCSCVNATGTPRLAIGILTAPREPADLPLLMAKRIADNVDRHRTDLFVQQSHKASGNTADRAKFEEMGYHVTSLTEPWPQLADNVQFPLTWVCDL